MTQDQNFTTTSAGDEAQPSKTAQEETAAASDPAASAGHAEGSAHGLPGASADIAFTALLAEDLAGSLGDHEGSLFAPTQYYDGHVALALDPGMLPNIDTALDLLTSSPHLFDVPVIDLPVAGDDVSVT